MLNANTKNCDVRLFTDPDTYALRLYEDVLVHTSLPSTFTYRDGVLGTGGGFGMSDLFHNPGFGIDLGAEYRFDEKFSAVAAIRDLGFIRWGFNNLRFQSDIQDAGQFYDNGSFLFNGLEISQLQQSFSDEQIMRLSSTPCSSISKWA